jgi:hypothetical protein
MRGRVQLQCHKRMLDQTHRLVIVIIMTSLPHLTIKPLSVEDGGGYLIEFPDFPGCIADGETPEQAMHEGRDSLCTLRGIARGAMHLWVRGRLIQTVFPIILWCTPLRTSKDEGVETATKLQKVLNFSSVPELVNGHSPLQILQNVHTPHHLQINVTAKISHLHHAATIACLCHGSWFRKNLPCHMQ